MLFAPVPIHAMARGPAPCAGRQLSTPEGSVSGEEKQEADENEPICIRLGEQARGEAGPESRAGGDGLYGRQFRRSGARLWAGFCSRRCRRRFATGTPHPESIWWMRARRPKRQCASEQCGGRLSKLDEQIAAMRAQAEKDSALTSSASRHRSKRRSRRFWLRRSRRLRLRQPGAATDSAVCGGACDRSGGAKAGGDG